MATHFAQRPVTVDRAWEFVYRELLWIDGSTGLAHLYESDKAQPGRSVWYERTVNFTNQLCAELGNIDRQQLKVEIDQLFRECLRRSVEADAESADGAEPADIAAAVVEGSDQLPLEIVQEAQAAPDTEEAFIRDAELVAQLAQVLVERLGISINQAQSLAVDLKAKSHYYYTVERKRQNSLGEGFEDLLYLLLTKLTTVPSSQIQVRKKADDLPGFGAEPDRDRIEAPDIAVTVGNETKLLASVKWSLRHDRQKQLSDELDCYAALLSQDAFPRYVLITNEYDPGRLVNTNALRRRGQTVSCIYHVNPDFLREALADGKYQTDIHPLVRSGRLRSIADFLRDLENTYGANVAGPPLTADQRRRRRRSEGRS